MCTKCNTCNFACIPVTLNFSRSLYWLLLSRTECMECVVCGAFIPFILRAQVYAEKEKKKNESTPMEY